MSETTAPTTGATLVLNITVERLEGCTADRPLSGKTPLGKCSIVAIGFPDGGTVLRMDGGPKDYRTELPAPQGAEFVEAILANVVPAAAVPDAETRESITAMKASIEADKAAYIRRYISRRADEREGDFTDDDERNWRLAAIGWWEKDHPGLALHIARVDAFLEAQP